MSTYQCSVWFYICDLNLEAIEKFQANNYRLPDWKKTLPFAHGNFRKFVPEFGPRPELKFIRIITFPFIKFFFASFVLCVWGL